LTDLHSHAGSSCQLPKAERTELRRTGGALVCKDSPEV